MKLKPTVTPADRAGSRDCLRYSHDSFAVIRMSTPTGGDGILFGSDLPHHQCVTIEIDRATLDRDLSHDWIHSEQPILKLAMSHAQFAQFITSAGNSSGTPCTLEYAPPPGTPCPRMPGIERDATAGETFRKEIRDSAYGKMDGFRSALESLGAMIESGRTSKKDLREIHRTLTALTGNLPSNLAYTVKCAEEAIEKSKHSAMIDIEAYSMNVARRLGLQSMQQLVDIANNALPAIEKKTD